MHDTLLQNGTVITYDERTSSLKVLSPADVLIRDGRIASIAGQSDGDNTSADLTTDPNVEVLDCTNHIVTPGFVNTHFHSWQTALRTMGPNETLASYFVRYSQMSPRSKEWTPDDIYNSALEGYLEGLNAGITSYLEHAHSNWSTDVVKPAFDAAVDSGARIWWCYHPIQGENITLEKSHEVVRSVLHNVSENSLVRPGLALDGFESQSEQQLKDTKQLAHDIKAEAFTTHCLGGPWPSGQEYPQIAKAHGLTDLGAPFVYSHSGFMTADDIAALKAQNNYISIAAQSEMHFGQGQASLLSNICDLHTNAALGTDTAKAFSNNILLEARMWLQRVRSQHYELMLADKTIPKISPMNVEEAFLLATRNGGRALHRDDIGVIKVGAVADLVVFDTTSPNMLGWWDAVAAVVLHANVGDIKHVMVEGEFRKRDGKLVLKAGIGSWDEVKNKYLETARRLQKIYEEPLPLGDKPLYGWTSAPWAEQKQVSAGK